MKNVVVNEKQKLMLEYLINGYENEIESGVREPGTLYQSYLSSFRFHEDETNKFNTLMGTDFTVLEAQKAHQYICNQPGVSYGVSAMGVFFFNVDLVPQK